MPSADDMIDDNKMSERARRLIFCFDGSWNKLDVKKDPTNVVLVAESVVPVDRNGVNQLVYYDEGVGTASDETLRGGIFGKGLVQNIKEAYRFLIFNYRPGDQIFVFGFSRGAFTARSFLGFIKSVGILQVNNANQITEAWKLYKKYAIRDGDEPPELLKFRAENSPHICISAAEQKWRINKGFCQTPPRLLTISYIGVWDTVGTLGFEAIKATFVRTQDKRYHDHDTQLSDLVLAGRHAVALDERRVHFMPTLWRNVADMNNRGGHDPYSLDAPYQQRWFAGDHGSVGGGGPERGLSNAALHWVLKGALNQGLEINLGSNSNLKTIRYNARAPLRNTPAEGLKKNKLATHVAGVAAGWFKSVALAAKRSSPDDITSLHPSVLRRWFLDDDVPEGRPYGRTMLKDMTDDIERLRPAFQPPDGDSYPVYTVERGDTLRDVALDCLGGVSRSAEIFGLNRDLIDDPSTIFVGDRLRMPKDADPTKVDFSPDTRAGPAIDSRHDERGHHFSPAGSGSPSIT